MSTTEPLLFYADSYRFPEVYHSTRFLAPDPFVTLEKDGEVTILTSSLEYGRAQKDSRAQTVRNYEDYGMRELVAQGLRDDELMAAVIAPFLQERGVRRAGVPRTFPLGLADALRARGIELLVRAELEKRRRAKRDDEIAAMEHVQRATEEAWGVAVDALRRATVRRDGVLELEGEVLTAERLRAAIERALLDRGCAVPGGTIVAPGLQAADPHQLGSGPIRAGEAIVMDIFPQDSRSRYCADMTRTVARGEPPEAIRRMYEVVQRAQDEGIRALRPGITGREVHELVEDVIYAAGYDTLRPGQQRHPASAGPRGFIHGTGHGVGLEIHEEPRISRSGTEPLIVGDVVTIEPGIYESDVGGVRLEDMLVITPEGARDLTRAPRELVV
jgi:Xaa-Pro aminopeptidase